MTRQQVIDRIRKMRALATGTGNEATTARRLADDLMKKHDIKESEVLHAEEQERDYRGPKWCLWLAKGIAVLRSVGTYECRVSFARDNQVRFTGSEHHLATEDYKWFYHRIELVMRRRTSQQGLKPGWLQDYEKGVIAGVLRNCKRVIGLRLVKSAVSDPPSVVSNIMNTVGSLADVAKDVVVGLKEVSAFDQGVADGKQVPLPPWMEPSKSDIDDLLETLFGDF